jgi:hypothetical protein
LVFSSLAPWLLLNEAVAKEWVVPNADQCQKGGGEMIPAEEMRSNGQWVSVASKVCSASYGDAKKICRALDAEVPSTLDFERHIENCGAQKGGAVSGGLGQYKINYQYLNCSSAKGLRQSGYWTSSESYASDIYYVFNLVAADFFLKSWRGSVVPSPA